jgi:hypothetical protein
VADTKYLMGYFPQVSGRGIYTKYLTGWSLLPLQFVIAVQPSLPESVTGNPRLQLAVAFAIELVFVAVAVVISFAE